MSESYELTPELRKELEYLRRQNRLFRAILEKAPILISAKDLAGNVLITSEQFSLLEGPAPAEYVDRNVFDLFPEAIAEQLWNNDLKAQQSSVPIIAEEAVYHRDGTLHTYHSCKFRLTDDHNTLIGTCAVSFDITHLKELEHDVLHDPLTELLNRRSFLHSVDFEMKRAARSRQLLFLALLDLDGFKEFNDRYGHVKGDDLLRLLASEIESTFRRPSDFGFRLGGDEFAVLFSAASQEKALQIMNRFRKGFQSQYVLLPDVCEGAFSVSIGVKPIDPSEETSAASAYEQADAALYQVKMSGKNQCCLLTMK